MSHLNDPLAIFVIQAIVIVAASRLIGLVARRLDQPMVIAETVAGILLGPSVLGALAPGVEDWLFPKSSIGALGLLSQAGLLLFMFIIGLELDPKLLRGRARASMAISWASIVVPFALGIGLAFVFHRDLAPAGVPLGSFALFMGISMSVTAFPVLARILVERRLLRTRVGAIAISCAAVDDVTAWCLLAVVVSIARSASLWRAGITIALALAYVAFMFVVVRPVLERLAMRTRTGMSQNLVAVIIICVFASSLVTELIGIHALFGAFLFGAIVPKHGSLAVALAEKIEDLIVVLLLPLFFAFSGLRTHVGLMDNASSWLTAGVIIVAACLGKFGGSVVAARLSGLAWREASAIGILMNTRGLMELIVLNIGLDMGLLSPRLFAMMVIMALVTTFMTTPLVQRVYPLERFLSEFADGSGPPSTPSTYTVLACLAQEGSAPGLVTLAVAISGSAGKRAVYGLRLASADDRASTRLAGPGDGTDTDLAADVTLDAAITRARALGSELRPVSFVSAMPAKDICAVAEVKRAQIVLLGWHRPLISGRKLGGIVDDVLGATPKEVGVLFDRGLDTLKRALVAYGGEGDDAAALRLAARLAQSGVRVTVLVHASTDEKLEVLRAEAEQPFATVDPSAFTVSTATGTPADVLVANADGQDLVVAGLAGRWSIAKKEDPLADVKCSVLVVRRGTGDESSLDAEPPSEADRARYSTLRPPA